MNHQLGVVSDNLLTLHTAEGTLFLVISEDAISDVCDLFLCQGYSRFSIGFNFVRNPTTAAYGNLMVVILVFVK